MSQMTHGLRAALSNAKVYDLVQNTLGAERYRRTIAREYVRPDATRPLHILDVGCGTAEILLHLPRCSYVGIDMSADYIAAAKRRHGDRATFLCASIRDASFRKWDGQFDLALMLGLLHHLDDEEVLSLMTSVGPSLREGGRVLSVDPTIADETHAIGRWLARRDRGRNVRTPQAYEVLARRAFDEVTLVVRHDLLRVPYSHAILDCSRPIL